MQGNMGCRYSLTCGAGDRAHGVILAYFSSGGMRVKGSLAYHRHLEHACIYPRLKCCESLSRALVFPSPTS